MLEAGTINCGVPQGSILGPLLFLLYINDIQQALSDSHTHMYADNTTISYQHKDVSEIKNALNKEFANMCEWFVDNKLSVHFGKDKTKCILFSKVKNLPGVKITYKNNRIKKSNIVEYRGCYLDANLSGIHGNKISKFIEHCMGINIFNISIQFIPFNGKQ